MGEFDDPIINSVKSPAIPRFHVIPVKMEFASSQAGRAIFEDREFVDIIIPGDRRAQAHEPVNDEHRARWPKEYASFKAGREAPLEGTPLAEWPSMSRSRVEELAYFNIRTLEQMAAVNDAQLQNLGMGARVERESARVALEAARSGSAPIERLLHRIETLTRENERLTRDLAAVSAHATTLREELDQLKGAFHAGAAA